MIAPEIDETLKKGEVPRSYALRVAVAKMEAVAAKEQGSFVLAADTVVAAGRRVLPKAEDGAEVERCLKLLSGRRHMVLTALALTAVGCGGGGSKNSAATTETATTEAATTEEATTEAATTEEAITEEAAASRPTSQET